MYWRFHLLKSFIRKAEPISLLRGIESDACMALIGWPKFALGLTKPPWLVGRVPESEPANQRFGLIHLLRRDLLGRLGRGR